MNTSTITVLGAGYVGLTTAALFAHADYKVYVIEPNEERLNAIKSGRSWFFENGIDPIIQTAIEEGSLIPTNSYEDSVADSSVVFSCVGTPDNPDGSSNLTYVFSAAEEAAKYLQPGSIYVQKSTVPVGTGQKIETLFEKLGKNISYVSNPEFLREGTAIHDTLYFDRVVAGGRDTAAVNQVLSLYRKLEDSRDQIARIGNIEPSSRKNLYIATSLNSAELIKVTSNAFLALKISFANSIAVLADQVDADVIEVMDAVGADKRIGRSFLNAGRGYGGGCFPKDVSGLISSGLEYGVNLEIMQAAQDLNQSMPGYVVEKLKDAIGELKGKKVAVLGLAFKSGTSDVRKSPGIAIANLLAKYGASVTAYDPEANDEARPELTPSIALVDEFVDSIQDIDAIVITTDWSNFKTIDEVVKGQVVVDAVNMFDSLTQNRYIGIGRS